MTDFRVSKDTIIDASPEALFAIVSDLTQHKQLAGSGELVDVRQLTSGPMGLGSVVEVNESIQLGDRHLEFLARSIVVTFNPPHTISWIPTPPLPIRRIQWWFRLSKAEQGTKVAHEVEVDLDDEAFDMFGGVENFAKTRGADMAQGMDKTLENLRRAVDRVRRWASCLGRPKIESQYVVTWEGELYATLHRDNRLVGLAVADLVERP